ncbi:hypothetical protein E3O44_12700 [Cryobacterium algoricola]|uniref:Uncharacterized protein n=1 Tax=Cryobacterium algoricola TaxID=1259183 RepID=A0ABY2IAI0_9MICO|nr:hypothetical protein [Cryobacterium algoricola]TFB85855.1 hypothetical protein E3O44_12700 [Cryobacterium algoricola]
MNSRLDRQVENVPGAWLVDLANDINQIKVGRQSFGPESLIVQRTVTGSTWDINGDAIAAYAVQQYRVVFAPNKTINPYAELTYNQTITGADGFEKTFLWPDGSLPQTIEWRFTVANDANAISLYVQFSIKCVDAGTIRVTRL